MGFMLVALITAGHFGLAMGFPWECKAGGKQRRLARSIVAQLPDGNAPLTIVGTKSEFDVEGELVGINSARSFATLISGRELRFPLIEDVLQKIAECPDTRLDDLVVIGQADGQITRRDDVEALIRARQASYLTPQTETLSFAFNSPRDDRGTMFAACDIGQKTVGCLETRDSPLDTIAYDLVSVGFVRPNQLPSRNAWLEWYGQGNQQPLGRIEKKIEGGQATFMLRSRLDWLAAQKVIRITTGLVDGNAIPFLGAICIRKQPFVRKLQPEAGLPLLRPAVNLQSLKRSGAVSNDN